MQNLSAGDWEYADHVWDFSNLWLLRPGDWHAVWVGWTDGTHRGWYVNFQEPFSRTARCISAMDLMLDIVVQPDRSWSWKDNEQFDEIARRGIFDEATIRRVREEAAAVVPRIERGDQPFCDPWPAWRPDPAWELPRLPDDWNVLPTR